MKKTSHAGHKATLLAVIEQLLGNELKQSYNTRRYPMPLAVSRLQGSKNDLLSVLVKRLQSKGWEGYHNTKLPNSGHFQNNKFIPLNLRTQELLNR